MLFVSPLMTISLLTPLLLAAFIAVGKMERNSKYRFFSYLLYAIMVLITVYVAINIWALLPNNRFRF